MGSPGLECGVSFLTCLFSATLCPHPNIMAYIFPQKYWDWVGSTVTFSSSSCCLPVYVQAFAPSLVSDPQSPPTGETVERARAVWQYIIPLTPSTRCSPGPGQWMWLRIIKDGWSGPEGQLEPQASVFSRASCCLCAGPSGEVSMLGRVVGPSAQLGLERQCY